MTKAERYRKLVDKVKKCSLDCNSSGKGTQLLHCDDCNEINLWSYWQGGENHLDAKIMLVGQDWGCYDPQTATEAKIVQAMIKNPDMNYRYTDGNTSITDTNLIKLFSSIGYDITQDQKDLFFTNLVLCYRDKGYSGKFKQKWVNNCSVYFKELADIIQPKVILCLGRATYEGVMKVLGQPVKINNYNSLLDKHMPSVVEGYVIFPLAHCGGMGTSNRNRGKATDKNNPLKYQIEDWLSIKKYL